MSDSDNGGKGARIAEIYIDFEGELTRVFVALSGGGVDGWYCQDWASDIPAEIYMASACDIPGVRNWPRANPTWLSHRDENGLRYPKPLAR